MNRKTNNIQKSILHVYVKNHFINFEKKNNYIKSQQSKSIKLSKFSWS